MYWWVCKGLDWSWMDPILYNETCVSFSKKKTLGFYFYFYKCLFHKEKKLLKLPKKKKKN